MSDFEKLEMSIYLTGIFTEDSLKKEENSFECPFCQKTFKTKARTDETLIDELYKEGWREIHDENWNDPIGVASSREGIACSECVAKHKSKQKED